VSITWTGILFLGMGWGLEDILNYAITGSASGTLFLKSKLLLVSIL
jgi:hypothetical protein